MKSYLFIGGPADGQRYVLPDVVTNHFVPDQKPPAQAYQAKFSLRASQTHYVLQQVRGEENFYEVFTPRGTSGDDLIRLLLLNYRPQPAK